MRDWIVEEGTFESAFPEKTHIYFKNCLPKKSNFKKMYHVIFQHGMIEHHQRHEEFFTALFDHFNGDIIISAMDLYGHGKSGGDRGYIDKFDTFLADFKSFNKILYHRFYLDRVLTPIYVSHSLGGLITLKVLSSDDAVLDIQPKGCVFVNPCLKPKLELPKEVINFVDGLPETLLRVRVPLIYNAYDLSHDEGKAREFIQDHLISKSVTMKLASETLKATKDINSVSYFFNYPSLFLVSEDDRVVEAQKTELFYTGMDKKLARKVNYPNMRHDLLNETCRNEVFEEIIAYIDDIGLR